VVFVRPTAVYGTGGTATRPSGDRPVTADAGPPTPSSGQGEVDWDAFFGTLRELNFDGVATACVFAWEERARESSAFMLDRIGKELAA
jgi:hypothetical protein